ncbi:MAG: hypothetical protein GY787_08680 [Alteromonadales bacterium]|nr:hypothetical protein [Alteromonadales bacterium]
MSKQMEYADRTNILDGSGTHTGRFNAVCIVDATVDIVLRNTTGNDVTKTGVDFPAFTTIYNLVSITVSNGCVQCSW